MTKGSGPLSWPLSLVVVAGLLVAPVAAHSQQRGENDNNNLNHESRIALMGVSTLAQDQRAIVYVRAKDSPRVIVVVRATGGSAEDVAAGYETALRMLRQTQAPEGHGKHALAPRRVVVGPAALARLTADQQRAYDRYLDHLRRARQIKVPGIGEGPMLLLQRRM